MIYRQLLKHVTYESATSKADNKQRLLSILLFLGQQGQVDCSNSFRYESFTIVGRRSENSLEIENTSRRVNGSMPDAALSRISMGRLYHF